MLLNQRYMPGEYQPVPDNDRGDAGIEGFSHTGCAYQMYAPEGELTTSQRHIKIRDKMTQDVGKFINNRDTLSRIFGTTKIRRWILLVPKFDSKETVAHAAKSTERILAAGLPYVDSGDFRVVVLDESSFAAERDRLLNTSVPGISIDSAPISEVDVDDWSADQTNFAETQNLTLKIAKLPTLSTAESRAAFQREVIRWWLIGQNVMEELRNYPETWESVRRAKSEQERYLRGHSLASTLQPYDLLRNALDKIMATVEAEVRALGAGPREAVAHEAVADWLMRCPLDFPGV